jgi:hypothetical protein
MVLVLVLTNAIVLVMIRNAGRQVDLQIHRADTVHAFYAAEGAMNMAVRELIEGADEDGDGGVGTISDDSDPGTDPAIGPAAAYVTSQPTADGSLHVSRGTAGLAQRDIEVSVE